MQILSANFIDEASDLRLNALLKLIPLVSKKSKTKDQTLLTLTPDPELRAEAVIKNILA